MASDIIIDFSLGANGDIQLVTGIEEVLNRIKNVLLTGRGERVMRPEFGSPLSLFKVDYSNAETLIRDALKRYVPEAKVLDVLVKNMDNDPSKKQIDVVVDVAGNTITATLEE